VNRAVEKIDVPTASEVAALIPPQTPSADAAMIDKLCSLTDGCEFFEGREHKLNALNNNDAADDFIKQFSKLIGLEDDEYNIGGVLASHATAHELYFHNAVQYKDGQVRAYTEKAMDEGSWELKVFARVTYRDIDSSDDEVVYVVITSVLDEGDYDSLSMVEVARNFEFA
jgi:hypothetical protein